MNASFEHPHIRYTLQGDYLSAYGDSGICGI